MISAPNHRVQRGQTLLRQRGVALVISMILLVVMTLVSLAGIRIVTGQERMVSYTVDRSVAFQAAEASLRVVEDQIDLAGIPTPAAGTPCGMQGAGAAQVMMCGAPAAGNTPRWLDPAFASWTASPSTVTSVVTPSYFVEYLGDTYPCSADPVGSVSNCRRYRVTVRADTGGGRSNVMLQSLYSFGN